MDYVRSCLARNLKLRRELLEISQAQLAEASGLSVGYIGSLETAKNWPSSVTLSSLARALGTRPWLLIEDPDMRDTLYTAEEVSLVLEQARNRVLKNNAPGYLPGPGEGEPPQTPPAR